MVLLVSFEGEVHDGQHRFSHGGKSSRRSSSKGGAKRHVQVQAPSASATTAVCLSDQESATTATTVNRFGVHAGLIKAGFSFSKTYQVYFFYMLEQFPQNNNDKGPDGVRRKFLKGIFGLSTLAAVSLAGNKYFEKEKETNELFERFKGKEGDFSSAVYATETLVSELEKANLVSVKVTGTGHSNEKIDVIRDFLTRHLSSEFGKRYGGIRESVLRAGVYTKENLAVLGGKAKELSK